MSNLLDTFGEHENGQLRLTADGEQLALLPLPDSLIPNDAELQAVDDERSTVGS